jgi:AraC-like DNA-binding protein
VDGDDITQEPAVDAGQDVYPPDADEFFGDDDSDDGTGVPIPRAAQVRQRALQAAAANAAGTNLPQPVKKMRGGQRKLLAQQKRKQALELRKGGATYDQIAASVGYKDASGARKAVKAAMDGITQEAAGELKVIQIERYNHMLLTLWGKVQTGDERAIGTALSIMDRLNDLERLREQGVTVNIDASTHENSILVIDGNKDDYIAAMKRMVGVTPDGVNVPDTQQITAHPAEGVHPQPVDSAGDNARERALDIVEGVVVTSGCWCENPGDKIRGRHHAIDCPHTETSAGDDPTAAPESIPAKPTKKKFKFGVDPTIKRST